jgi:hypothetical protein
MQCFTASANTPSSVKIYRIDYQLFQSTIHIPFYLSPISKKMISLMIRVVSKRIVVGVLHCWGTHWLRKGCCPSFGQGLPYSSSCGGQGDGGAISRLLSVDGSLDGGLWAETHVLSSQSLEQVILCSDHHVMMQLIACHGNVVKFFKSKATWAPCLGVGSDGVLPSACPVSNKKSQRDHLP